MGALKFGEPFGLDNTYLSKINWDLALKRIIHNLRFDFIYAPHLSQIYRKAGIRLIEDLKKELKSGEYIPGSPVTMEVPKTFRVNAPSLTRLGPNFSRPGSILLPRDRLFYQALADQAAL